MSQPNHPDDRTRPGSVYEAPTLLPTAGQERTYALIVAGIPLLLILLISVLPSLASADTGSSGSSGASDGTGGAWWASPSAAYSGEQYPTEQDPTDPYPSEAYPTEEYTGTDDDSGLWGTSPSPSGSVSPSGGPDATVLAYYDAVNARDYETAWELGGKNLGDAGGYQGFVLGYQDTARAEVTVESVDGDTVTVGLLAEGTDGTQKSYRGTYTVVDGVITSGSMDPVGSESGAATP
ncbi:hypothetical protein ABZ490_01320 [Streptomyces sp. NPDC005811]|uniref:hypothetical protein n=1 Tax=Streptomyces sp. NPDC005811 TaxID=3154565 RepID=UPI003405B969